VPVTKILFVFGLCMLAFFYGAGAIYLKIFPYAILRDAKLGFDAWLEITRDDQTFEFVDDGGQPTPQVTQLDIAEEDDSYILMTGDPYTLISECPKFGCIAWIMNRRGQVLHTWEVDLGQLWAETPDHTGLKNHQDISVSGGLHLYDNGDLIANFGSKRMFPYGIGMAKFDKHGNLIWKRANFSHHWFSVAPDGLIYTPAHRLSESPLPLGDTKQAIVCEVGKIYNDVILVVSPEGDTVAEISVIELLMEQGFIGLLLGVDGCDPIHLNYVEYVTAERAQVAPGLNEGDLIISTPMQDMIGVVDGATRKLKWALVGKTGGQHSPRLLADGSIIALDNRGGRRESGGSRIVRIEYGRDFVEEVFPRPDVDDGINFYTENSGHIDPHPDGTRALVSLTRQGRVVEIDLQQGRVLWELLNTHDPGPYADRVGANEGQVVRFEASGAYYVGQPAFLRK
jgi:hypothetical protein